MLSMRKEQWTQDSPVLCVGCWPMEEFPQPPVPELSWWPPGFSQVDPLVSMGLPQAEVPLSTETGGPAGSPQVDVSIFCGALYVSPHPEEAELAMSFHCISVHAS